MTSSPASKVCAKHSPRNFDEFGEVGAGFALYVEGRNVVDLWGGTRTDTGSSYDGETLQVIFSSTKGVTATRTSSRSVDCSTSMRRW